MLEINKVSKKYGKKQVLTDVSFEIADGDFFGLIGPNGAGKSTLINVITGIVDPLAGDVKIGGYDIKKQAIEAKRLIGLVPQELALDEETTARDNLMFFGGLYGLYGKKLKVAVDEALELSALKDRKKEHVKKFSGGMKRRLNLVAAIMHKPKLIILDEPTVGIDPQSRNNIFEFLQNINTELKTTILYTSHYMEEVEQLCKNIFVIDEGKEVAYGSLESVKEKASSTLSVALKVDNTTDSLLGNLNRIDGIINIEQKQNELSIKFERSKLNLDEMIKAVQNSNSVIRGLDVNELNLGEVFLELTGKKLRE